MLSKQVITLNFKSSVKTLNYPEFYGTGMWRKIGKKKV